MQGMQGRVGCEFGISCGCQRQLAAAAGLGAAFSHGRDRDLALSPATCFEVARSREDSVSLPAESVILTGGLNIPPAP